MVRSARAAFPEMAWFIGSADLHRWRGELDYWVFADRQVGQVAHRSSTAMRSR